MPGDFESAAAGDVLDQFASYEDYLDAQVSETDMYYLEDEELARQLVELGYRGSGDTLKRDEFEARKKALRERGTQKANVPKQLASADKDLSQLPFLLALANREELVRNGKLTCIIFLRCLNAKKQEVSGYIDFAHRLKSENFESYFTDWPKKKLMPKPTDLSYYNWETQTSTANSSPNFQVIADSDGLLFKNKRDRKVINVDPKQPPGDNSSRNELKTEGYLQVVIFDHLTRRKK
ncbi:hypothetical protein M885DRAFT_517798 [Pelagophyceae sp. CCMP2097]|nr:hypothetical protein M885DRAFT_517798 [Pelagophyceae sp. CCMP2097]